MYILTLVLLLGVKQPYTRPIPNSCSNPVKCSSYVQPPATDRRGNIGPGSKK